MTLTIYIEIFFQGWIKGVNSNTLSAVRDPGRDGDLSLAGNTHAKVATDAFGYTLGYFAGDYNPIGTFTTASKFEASTAGSDLLAARSDLWNGNISHMVTCLPKASDYAANQTITPEAFGSAYKYDQLNRLSSSRVFTNVNNTTNQWQSGAVTNPTAYATDYTYDAMGNILTQKRNGGGASPTALDELTYNYHTTTDGLVSNRLYQVNDVVSAGNYSDDIDDQGTFNNTHSTIETANNYGYDELGNLVRDVQEEIASIEWTVYGKMKKITRNSGSSKADLEFGYDASGNRLWKKVTPKGSGAVISTYYYLRDAQGNEMCRYVKYTNTSSQLMYVAQEHSIYGSSRVGVDGRKDTLYKAGNYSPSWGGVGISRRDLGSKSFELANHLGNVLVTVSDKPVYKVSSGTIYFNPEITSTSDYYPFGAPITGRSFSSTEYRFGFNGKELDHEVSGEGNSYDYGARMYSARLGKWFAVDPKMGLYPGISPHAYALNTPINAIDPDGQLVIFINGYRPCLPGVNVYREVERNDQVFRGDKLGYWSGVDKQFMNRMGDHNSVYADGDAPTLTAENQMGFNLRVNHGRIAGQDLISKINSGEILLQKNGAGEVIESIKVVSHSMGYAYSLGMQKELEAAGYKVEVSYNLAPENPTAGNIPDNVIRSVQYGSGPNDPWYQQDRIASQSDIKNIDENAYIPDKNASGEDIPKGPIDSHLGANFGKWIFGIKPTEEGYVAPRQDTNATDHK